MKPFLHLILCLLLLVVASCRTCPIEACHIRKIHLHSGVKYHGQPWYKKQNPAIGEKIRTLDTSAGKHDNDHSKPLK